MKRPIMLIEHHECSNPDECVICDDVNFPSAVDHAEAARIFGTYNGEPVGAMGPHYRTMTDFPLHVLAQLAKNPDVKILTVSNEIGAMEAASKLLSLFPVEMRGEVLAVKGEDVPNLDPAAFIVDDIDAELEKGNRHARRKAAARKRRKK